MAAMLAITDNEEGPVELDGHLFGVGDSPPALVHTTIARETIESIEAVEDGAVYFDVGSKRISTELRFSSVPVQEGAPDLGLVGTVVDGDDLLEFVVLDDPVVLPTLIVVAAWAFVCLGKHVAGLIAADRADDRRIKAGMTNTEMVITSSIDGEPELDLSFPDKIKARLRCKGKITVGPKRGAEVREFADS